LRLPPPPVKIYSRRQCLPPSPTSTSLTPPPGQPLPPRPLPPPPGQPLPPLPCAPPVRCLPLLHSVGGGGGRRGQSRPLRRSHLPLPRLRRWWWWWQHLPPSLSDLSYRFPDLGFGPWKLPQGYETQGPDGRHPQGQAREESLQKRHHVGFAASAAGAVLPTGHSTALQQKLEGLGAWVGLILFEICNSMVMDLMRISMGKSGKRTGRWLE
ncbi:unnamed protein product, partial [Urochloa humidicola]